MKEFRKKRVERSVQRSTQCGLEHPRILVVSHVVVTAGMPFVGLARLRGYEVPSRG